MKNLKGAGSDPQVPPPPLIPCCTSPTDVLLDLTTFMLLARGSVYVHRIETKKGVGSEPPPPPPPHGPRPKKIPTKISLKLATHKLLARGAFMYTAARRRGGGVSTYAQHCTGEVSEARHQVVVLGLLDQKGLSDVGTYQQGKGFTWVGTAASLQAPWGQSDPKGAWVDPGLGAGG